MCSESLATNVLPTSTDVVDKNKGRAIAGKKRKITCQKCSEPFRTRNEAMLHYCNSPSLSSIKCRYCGREFNSLGALKNHKKKHTNIALFLCRNCGSTFQTWKARRIHLLKECRGRSLQSTSNACDDSREDFNSLSANGSHKSSTEHSHNSDEQKMVLRKPTSLKHSQKEVNGTSTPNSSDFFVKTKMNSATVEGKNTSEQKMILKKSGVRKRSLKEVNSTLTSSISDASVNSGKNSATAEDKDTSEHTETGSMKSYSLGKRIRYRTYSDSIWLVG
ncbi:zinc finger protein pat-9 [Anabrus simplex]|uniref:zinc finger protein pat-9 n=1 Tax=Anabrus simplex TaxID=316456 RepID=UPI0034DDC5C2